MIKTNPALLAREMLTNDRASGVNVHHQATIENRVTVAIYQEAAAMEIEYDEDYALEVAAEYFKLANQKDED